MKLQRKRLRDEARFQTFAHLSKGIIAYVLSGIISTLVVNNMLITADTHNVELLTTNLKTLGIVYLTIVLASVINMPLVFCAERFYLLISRQTPLEPLPLKRFFEPFGSPSLLLKGTVLLIVISILEILGIVVLVLPVYLAFSMSVFFLSDNPEISVFEALKRSAKMMRGKKMQTFLTILPLMVVYLFVTYFLSSLYFISFFVTSIIQIMIFVVLAMIYDRSKQ